VCTASFGFAVVPDVARMYAGSFASSSTCDPSWPTPFFRNSSQVISRPAVIEISACVLRKMTTRSTVGESPTAASTIPLSGTSFPLRKVTSEAKSALAPASRHPLAQRARPEPGEHDDDHGADADRGEHQDDRLRGRGR
jgi:hypothetical protein